MRILIVLLIVLLGHSVVGQTSPDEDTLSSRFALKMVSFLQERNYDSITVHFDSTMKRRLDASTIGRIYSQFEQQFGELKEVGTPKISRKDTLMVAVIPIKMERYPIEMSLTTNPQGQIAGLFLRLSRQTAQYNIPMYANQLCIGEKMLPVPTKDVSLPGRLTLPCKGEQFPLMVLVHGSGPQDMDVTVGPNKLFKDLSYLLAMNGIASYRYDKRTKVSPESIARPDLITVKEEVLQDVYDALNLVKGLDFIDTSRIYLVGHSLGGLLITRMLAESPVKLAGAVMMAAPASPLEDLILAQMKYLYAMDSKVSEEEKNELRKMDKQVAEVKALKKGDHIAGSRLPLNLPSSYWLDLRSHDPIKSLQKSTIPILVLHGKRDYQVSDAEYIKLTKAGAKNKKISFHQFEDLNHLFLPGKGKSTPAEYEEGGNVPLEVGKVISEWTLSK